MSKLNTHGLTCGPQNWRLFDIDGWQLLAALDGGEHDGAGIKYSICLEHGGIGEVSMWIGKIDADSQVQDHFAKLLTEMDHAKARAALQQLLDQVAPLLSEVKA